MKKHFLLLVIAVSLLPIALFAQSDTISYLKLQQLKVNLNVIGGSLSYEKRIGRYATLYLEAGAAYGFSYSYSSALGSDYRYTFSPFILAEGRRYYHFKERIAKSRSIANNATNFWFLQAGYTFEPVSHTAGYTFSDALSVMPGWGIQRGIGEHFNLELQLGLRASYYPQSSEWYVGPGGQFKIGYIIK